jgi:hypothetical protein
MGSVQPCWDKVSGKTKSVKSESVHITKKAKVHKNS